MIDFVPYVLEIDIDFVDELELLDGFGGLSALFEDGS